MVEVAKAEARIREADGTDHTSHIAKREAEVKDVRAKKRAASVARGSAFTAGDAKAAGKGIIPEAAQALLANGNKQTMDLTKTCGKDDLIAELKARGADTYPKTKRGKNIGAPTAAATLTMMKSLLKAANGGSDIAVRKALDGGGVGSSAAVAGPWNRRGGH